MALCQLETFADEISSIFFGCCWNHYRVAVIHHNIVSGCPRLLTRGF